MEKIVSGQNIYFRKMDLSDTSLIVQWRNSDFVRAKFIYQNPFTREDHENWIRTMIDTGKAIQFIICLNENDLPIGSVYIRDIDQSHNKGEYGIFIGELEYQGRGIGTEATKLTIDYAFNTLKLHRLILRVFANNEQAIRSYEKAGFTKEAYLRDDVLIQGKYRDIVLMAVINS